MEDLEQSNQEIPPDRPPSPIEQPLPFESATLTARLQGHKRFSVSSDSDLRFHSSPLAESSTAAESSQHTKPRPHLSSTKRISTSARPTLPHNVLPSAPASPPTPAPSPTPFQQAPSWATPVDSEEAFIRDTRTQFAALGMAESERFLAEILNMCNNHQLSFVKKFVSPRLKKDPFEHLPDELCLKVLCLLDEPRELARASQVSHRWHKLVNDEMVWKEMCSKHAYRTASASPDSCDSVSTLPNHPYSMVNETRNEIRNESMTVAASSSAPNLSSVSEHSTSIVPQYDGPSSQAHYLHFRNKYLIEAAWRKGGESIVKPITTDQGVVTSLYLTEKYIVVAMDNAKIHVFNRIGEHQKTLRGHVMGVWAMVPWDDILVSGGCDRDVRVWNMATGKHLHTMRGHTSTVRCLKMADAKTAISGSRDTTLRIWDLETGLTKATLGGHQASVRCLAIHGDIVVSGSYDTTAKLWSIKEGRYLRTLSGHFSQIYAVAFDGRRVATGSLDTSVRIWNPNNGQCIGVCQGHTSLVGQLQMRGDILVTGGSDGSVRVWNLNTSEAIHRLAAHDNSVTSLQFDDNRIVSGGSDGRVKIWSVATGQLVRELIAPAEAVWRVAFEEQKAVIMASRGNRTVMEIWSFTPPGQSPFPALSHVHGLESAHYQTQGQGMTTLTGSLPGYRTGENSRANPSASIRHRPAGDNRDTIMEDAD